MSPLRLVLAILVLVAVAGSTIIAPLGHATYTYAPKPFAGFNNFNLAPGNGSVKIVNTYAGYIVKSLQQASINCTSRPVPSDQQVILKVKNTAGSSVTILSCAKDSCHGHAAGGYAKCPQSIPAGGQATVALDSGLHFLVFVYNNSFVQECYPKIYGSFPPELDLPLKDPKSECAAAPRPPGPAPPLPASTYSYDLEPLKSTGAPQSDFSAWGAAEGVEWLVANVDGRMDLCQEYKNYNLSSEDCSSDPDLTGASTAELTSLATQISSHFCAIHKVVGVQLDLEPFRAPYAQPVVQLMGILAAQLRACVTPELPNGRFLGLFTFVESLEGTGLLEALGSNGFITISGYDLYPDSPDSKYNTVAEYQTKLRKQVDAAGALLSKSNTPWTVGIPMSASAHEYEAYMPDPTREHCGPACTQYNNTATMVDYLEAAMSVLGSDGYTSNLSESSLFRGVTLWEWPQPGAPNAEFPKHSGNQWYPSGPSDQALQYLKQHLPVV